MTARVASRIGVGEVLYFLLGLCSAPFIVTGIARLMPAGWPLAIPFVVLLGAAAVVWQKRLHAVATGMAAGDAAYAIFL